ncbi:uncharacterized protein N7479_003616 [Penicillium vulpinum]|uniref:uncharacterized protein n=1 Tax=Penicillium vulpinum TaxID=29845 RepID=UPI0025484D70|nr:uncharacterized protein N7479_003616 [Penicillium vulpinum]KAJ5963740.1 hypothetical protein N7479_003616 [Penicillium vulpinum]
MSFNGGVSNFVSVAAPATPAEAWYAQANAVILAVAPAARRAALTAFKSPRNALGQRINAGLMLQMAVVTLDTSRGV